MGRTPEEVTVNENVDGEATNNTTQEGNESTVENTDSIPQNGVSEIETTPSVNEVSDRADEARTEEDIAFSDEANPNQKARNAASPDEFDQDGNPRTGGYSYGVSPDDTTGTVPEKANAGTRPEDLGDRTDKLDTAAEQIGGFVNPADGEDFNNNEWTVEEQQKLEEQLSDPKKGISARVITSAGGYVKVKFFLNNKILDTFKTREYKKGDAKKFLTKLKKERDL